MEQPSLFPADAPAQPDLFAKVASPASDQPDPEDIRRRIEGWIATARAADIMPWPDTFARVNDSIIPRMARNCLAPDLADRLIAEWTREYARLRHTTAR